MLVWKLRVRGSPSEIYVDPVAQRDSGPEAFILKLTWKIFRALWNNIKLSGASVINTIKIETSLFGAKMLLTFLKSVKSKIS